MFRIMMKSKSGDGGQRVECGVSNFGGSEG
jgi:hypothetical protein